MSLATPEHVAIIMDGNGRWAVEQGLSRCLGHEQGATIIEPLVNHSIKKGIKSLSLFALSIENANRSRSEVAF